MCFEADVDTFEIEFESQGITATALKWFVPATPRMAASENIAYLREKIVELMPENACTCGAQT